jgi:hypothetical protein
VYVLTGGQSSQHDQRHLRWDVVLEYTCACNVARRGMRLLRKADIWPEMPLYPCESDVEKVANADSDRSDYRDAVCTSILRLYRANV